MNSDTTSGNVAGTPSIDADRVRQRLADANVPWSDVTVLASTGSTNADLIERVAAGTAAEGTVIAAGEQTAGRGRLGRDWSSPPGTLSFSVVLTAPPERATFVPALAGLAVVQAIAALGGPATSLKWPNDVMVDQLKVAGILAESAGTVVVLGCGINVDTPADELPVPTATSLSLHGSAPERADLLAACIQRIHDLDARWHEAGYDAEASGLLADYRAVCGTIGAQVRVALPDGSDITGRGEDVDSLGRLILATDGGERTLTAGDVVHLHSE